MASWKTSVASLTAFFERASRQQDLRDIGRGKQEDVVESSTVETSPGNEARSSDANNATSFESMVHDVWGDLLHHARESQYTDVDQIFSAAAGNLMNRRLKNVAEEVYRRELVAVLEAVSSHVAKSGAESCAVGAENAVVNSLKRRLKTMSKEAENSKVALQHANKEKYELEGICEEHEEKRRKLLCLWKQAEAGNKVLRSMNGALEEAAKLKEDQIQKLEAQKHLCDVERLRALHRAEMAELVGKQAALHARRVDRKLKNTLNSSRLVHQQVQGLERALEEVKTIVTNAVSSTEPSRSRSRWMEAQIGSLVHKSSKLFNRFRTSRSGDTNNIDGDGRNEEEGRLGETEGAGNGEGEKPSAPIVEKMRSLKMLFNLKRKQREESQARMLSRIASRLRGVGTEQGNNTATREAREEMNNRRKPGALGTADRDDDIPRCANMTIRETGLRRILSRGVRSEPEEHLLSTNLQAMESISKALENLEKIVETLRDAYETKDEEVYRLNQELEDAIKRSNEFEQSMKRECHKRLELENRLASSCERSTLEKTDITDKCTDNLGERERSTTDKVSVRWSCRWF